MRTISICFLAMLTCNAFSQNIDLPLDKVNAILCKKWEVDYALMGNMKIGRLPGAEELNYEFFSNGTFVMTSDDPSDKTNGNWKYDEKKKRIRLMIGSRNTSDVIALNDQELIMTLNTPTNGPSDAELKVIYKPDMRVTKEPEHKEQPKQIAINSSLVRIKNASTNSADASIVYVGRENLIKIVGLQTSPTISVSGADATLKKMSETTYLLNAPKQGTITITVSQDFKISARRQFTAVLPKK